MMKIIKLLFIVSINLFAACYTEAQYQLEVAFPGLTFTRPVDLQHPDDSTDRLFVVEQRGVISIFNNDKAVFEKKIFLDIQDRVRDLGNEEGLLGLVFHPDYQNNGYFYVDYTASNPPRTVIARYSLSKNNPDLANVNSELVLLEIPQPYSNHNGGQIVFGPDGYLYIAMGDGGSGGDPQGNGQNRQMLLGALLRIDVDKPTNNLNYGIPHNNPYVGNNLGYKEEIYAYGLRNPWRFSFDPKTNWLWAADVGQNRIEEIDIIQKGKNYGWNIMEGSQCYPPDTNCDTTRFVKPIWEYGHDLGQSVTGGFVYQGTNVPELIGAYIYADYVSGRIWSLRYDGQNPSINTLLIDTPLKISSFGIDKNNELYICAFDGKVYKFTPTATNIKKSSLLQPGTNKLLQNHPDPFQIGLFGNTLGKTHSKFPLKTSRETPGS